MAVAFDNKVTADNFGITGLVTGAFTISASANRGAILAIGGSSISSIQGGCGGSTGTLIASASVTFNGVTVALLGVKAPNSGSQTSSASWVTATSVSVGAVTATGVDQTTPFNNGVTKTQAASSATMSQVVTSAAGDLTCSGCSGGSLDNSYVTNQTLRNTDFVCQDTGPGTANPTHSWHSPNAQDIIAAYANFKAAASGTATAAPWLMAMMGVG